MAIPAFIRNHKLVTTLVLVIAVPLVALTIYTFAALHYVYASGERAGFLQKISKKGWICKTWEGELAQANLPGSMPQIFKFSVRNDSIAHLIQESLGKRVSLTYEEHRGLPTSCFGETDYYITNIHKLEP